MPLGPPPGVGIDLSTSISVDYMKALRGHVTEWPDLLNRAQQPWALAAGHGGPARGMIICTHQWAFERQKHAELRIYAGIAVEDIQIEEVQLPGRGEPP